MRSLRPRTARLVSAVGALAMLLPVASAVDAAPALAAPQQHGAWTQQEPDDPAVNPKIPYRIGPADQGGHPTPHKAVADDHEVTVRGIDRDGEVPGGVQVFMVDQDTGMQVFFAPTDQAGAFAAAAPEGEYLLIVLVATGDNPYQPDDLALHADPAFAVDRDATVTVDARDAMQVRATGPSSTAALYHNRIALTAEIAGQPRHVAVLNGSPTLPLRTFPTAPTDRPFHFVYMESQVDARASGGARDAYHLVFPATGQIPDDLAFTATADTLAELHATYASQGVSTPVIGIHQELFRHDELPFAYSLAHPVEVPGEARVFMTAGEDITRTGSFFYDDPTSGTNIFEQQFGSRTFLPDPAGSDEDRAGRPPREDGNAAYHDAWNLPAFGPTMEVTHVGNELYALPAPANTGQPDRQNYGSNNFQGLDGGLTLWRDGVEVGPGVSPLFGVWSVPPGEASYRLDYAYERDVPWSAHATEVEATWRFTSRAGDVFDLSNLLQARVTGDFDTLGRAPSDTLFPLDVVMQRPVDGTAIHRIRVRASFDDGQTWRPVALVPDGTDRWTGLVRHPRRHNGYVALEVTAEDRAGNSLTQTVTRAYGLS